MKGPVAAILSDGRVSPDERLGFDHAGVQWRVGADDV